VIPFRFQEVRSVLLVIKLRCHVLLLKKKKRNINMSTNAKRAGR
jgi:hypothetical protein